VISISFFNVVMVIIVVVVVMSHRANYGDRLSEW
jgi:hypothetical protein